MGRDGQALVLAMLPVTFVVSFGTFLLFSQASVAICGCCRGGSRFLQQAEPAYHRDLVFRMKENAWVLATVAVLSACVITATGTIYTAQATMLKDTEMSYPHAVTFAVSGELGVASEETGLPVLASAVEGILAEDKVTVSEYAALAGLMAKMNSDASILVVLRAGQRWARRPDARPRHWTAKAALLQPVEISDSYVQKDPHGPGVGGEARKD
jgi:hypothetical protein